MLIINRRRYGTYLQKSRIVEKMFYAAFKEKVSPRKKSN